MNPQVVLITGASSGIGKALAVLLAGDGHKVYGTSRRMVDIPGVHMLTADVRDETSVEETVAKIIEEQNRLDMLICNAGIGVAGSVEDTDLPSARAQFETNYFGALCFIRRVLPQMRSQGSGRILAIGSVASRLPIPFQAGYSASKAALAVTMEAMRGETKPYGILVSVLEPGDTKTGFTGARKLTDAAAENSPYRDRLSRSIARMARDEQGGVSPEKVALAARRILYAKYPPHRQAVGADYRLLLFLRRFIPDRLVACMIERMYAK